MKNFPFQRQTKYSSMIAPLFLFLLLLFCNVVTAQEAPVVQCGAEIEAEISEKDFDLGGHRYTLALRPGDSIDIAVTPIGDSFDPHLELNDGGSTTRVDDGDSGMTEQFHGITVSSTNPSLRVYNPYRSVGAYTLYVGCILRDGTVINPGDTIPDPASASASASASDTIVAPSPVSSSSMPDFSSAQTATLTPGTPVFGVVSPGGTELFSYTLDAEGGSLLDLTLSKSGNLNLSFVVLTSDNQVLFQTNLVNLTELKTSLTIPNAGTYTIGVFRIDLLPPATPEATAFQIQGTLNP
jgi:hypothetical protein